MHGTDLKMEHKVGWKDKMKQTTATELRGFRPSMIGNKKKSRMGIIKTRFSEFCTGQRALIWQSDVGFFSHYLFSVLPAQIF